MKINLNDKKKKYTENLNNYNRFKNRNLQLKKLINLLIKEKTIN